MKTILRTETHLPSPMSSRGASPAPTTVRVVVLLDKMSLGRASTQGPTGSGLFDVPFVIETACVRSKAIELVDPESGEKLEDFEQSKILMLGYSPHEDFIGEVRLKCYNAFNMITPKPRLEELGSDDDLSEEELRREILESGDDSKDADSESDSESDRTDSDSEDEDDPASASDAMSVNDEEVRSPSQASQMVDEVHLENAVLDFMRDPHLDLSIANGTQDDNLLSSPQMDMTLTGDFDDDIAQYITGDLTSGPAAPMDEDVFE